MRINWFTCAPLYLVKSELTSDIASARYRMLIPSIPLKSKGYAIEFVYLPLDESIVEVQNSVLPTDIVVFAKSFNVANEGFARSLKKAGTKIVVDLSDNYFETIAYRDHYKILASLADKIVVPTQSLADVVLECTGKESVIIGDPVEYPRADLAFPMFTYQKTSFFEAFRSKRVCHPIKLLWFGHHSNLQAIIDLIPELKELSKAYLLELSIVTSRNYITESIHKMGSTNMVIKFVEWSQETLGRLLKYCDLVLIPTDRDNVIKATKSPNRLTESIWAGKYAVAHPLLSYAEFSEFAWVSEDLVTGIKWAVTHPDMALEQVGNGQEYIQKNYSREIISKKWEAVFESCLCPCSSVLAE